MADLSAEALAKAVHATLDDAMATIPPGHRVAVLAQVTEGANGPQAGFTVAAHFGKDWQIADTTGWDEKAGLSTRFGVMWSH